MTFGLKKSVFKFSAVVALGLGLVACGDSGDGITTGDYKPASETQTSIPDGATGHFGDIVYGSKDAPVEVIEYASLTCPHCATFESTTFKQLKEKYIDTGKIRFIYRNFVMNAPDLQASVFMRCMDEDFAKKSKKILFERQRTWLSGDPANGLAAEARRMGIPRTRMDKCLANKDMQLHLAEMKDISIKEYDLNATPTLIVEGGKVEVPTFENLEKAIEAVLK